MISASRAPQRTAGRVGRAASGLLSIGLLAIVMTPSPAASKPKPPPPRYNFAGVPWLVAADTAIARLAERGYQEVTAARDRDTRVARGAMYEHDALATAYLDEQQRVIRWVVLIASRGLQYDWPDMHHVFTEIAGETQIRYGVPREVIERYRFPYEKGDSREDEALRDGKATIRRVWVSKSGDRLTLEMDHTAAVVLTYESPEWAALVAKRKAKKASDL